MKKNWILLFLLTTIIDAKRKREREKKKETQFLCHKQQSLVRIKKSSRQEVNSVLIKKIIKDCDNELDFTFKSLSVNCSPISFLLP